MWLIVDDGSTDGTCSLVSSWKREGKVDITYVKKENGGKPRAINTGVALCECPLFFCVDSDDHLVPGAVARIVDDYEAIRDDNRIAGIVALRGTDEHTPMVTWIPDGLTGSSTGISSRNTTLPATPPSSTRPKVLKVSVRRSARGEVHRRDLCVLPPRRPLSHEDGQHHPHHLPLPSGWPYQELLQKNARENPIGYRKHKLCARMRSQTLVGKFRRPRSISLAVA